MAPSTMSSPLVKFLAIALLFFSFQALASPRPLQTNTGLIQTTAFAQPTLAPRALVVRNPDSDLVDRTDVWSLSNMGLLWYTFWNTGLCLGYLVTCSTVCIFDVSKAGCVACLALIVVVKTCQNVVDEFKAFNAGPPNGGRLAKRLLQTPPQGYLPDCSKAQTCYISGGRGAPQVPGICVVQAFASQSAGQVSGQGTGQGTTPNAGNSTSLTSKRQVVASGGCGVATGPNGNKVQYVCDTSVKPQVGCGVVAQ